MADYIARARSNYFRVKDEAAFVEWAQARGLCVRRCAENGVTYFGIYVDGWDFGGWPDSFEDEESGDDIDFEIEEDLAEHLQEGSVAVLVESGAMGDSEVAGHSIAVNSKGESIRISLWDIYEAAKTLGDEVNTAGS